MFGNYKRINPRAAHSGACERISQNKNLLVPSLLRRHACLTTPVVKTCSRNGSQSNRKRIPPYRHSGIFIPRQRNENIRNLRRKAGLPSHRSSGGIFHRPGGVHTPRNALDRRREEKTDKFYGTRQEFPAGAFSALKLKKPICSFAAKTR